ncbi:hypothetical protein [Nocardia terpenica]|uniref:Uncharacterized protein n=1 Tax=Nocardia terpenica TaxID=455432 RepID=A0A164H0I0_9NOCA|nr:hypothetical protein [Nocardia terpenica]KZM68101.1 hypothetical protein AWN90_09170 [Nocardia terpenica]NQE89042.1 hypothetical protein [Nocardia terpenica]
MSDPNHPTILSRAYTIARHLGGDWVATQSLAMNEAVLRAAMRRCMVISEYQSGDLRIRAVVPNDLHRFVGPDQLDHHLNIAADTPDDRICAQITEAFLNKEDPASYESILTTAIDAEAEETRQAVGSRELAANIAERLFGSAAADVFVDAGRVQMTLDGAGVRFVQALTDHSLGGDQSATVIDGTRLVVDVDHAHTLGLVERIAAYISETRSN